MDDMPDLSHLTPHERMQIENVLMRQKQEEEAHNEIMRRKQDEVVSLEMQIRQRSEEQKKSGIELGAICHICLQTKFADGIGHICHYCNIVCCARCGGKVTLRSNKVIWVCILCRKKQELLSKTGQWMNKGQQQDSFLRRIEPDGSSDISQQAIVDPHDTLDKRPKLERTRSAAEKENLPMQRTGSVLRRQYSQQETPTNRRMSASDSGADVSPGQQRQRPMHQQQQQTQQQYGTQGGQQQASGGQRPFPDDDPRYYQGELDGLMRQHPHLAHPSQLQKQQQQQQGYHQQQLQQPPLQQQQQPHAQHAQYQHQQQQQQQQHQQQQQQHKYQQPTVSQQQAQQRNLPPHHQQHLPSQQQQLSQQQQALRSHMQPGSAQVSGGMTQQQHQQQQLRQQQQLQQQQQPLQQQRLPHQHSYSPQTAQLPTPPFSGGPSGAPYQKPAPLSRNLTISGGHAMDTANYPQQQQQQLQQQQQRRPLVGAQYGPPQQRSFSSSEEEIQAHMLAPHSAEYNYDGNLREPWRQQRSLNERDLLSVTNSYGANDYRLTTTNRLYSSADRDRYDLHRERLERYPLTRTARLDVQQQNIYNRTNHDRQPVNANSGAYTARRAPTLATATATTGGGGSSSSSSAGSYHHQKQSQQHHHSNPQIVIDDKPLPTSAYERYGITVGGGSRGEEGSARRIGAAATRSLGRDRSLMADPYWDETVMSTNAAQDSRRYTERRIKKTVRFDGHDEPLLSTATTKSGSLPPVTQILPSTAVDVGAATILTSAKLGANANTANTISISDAAADWARWDAERQGSQDSATKDSGIDTCSTFTSSEDSNRGDGPKQPVNWQISTDNTRLIGRMILRKYYDGEDILGLKVVGGQRPTAAADAHNKSADCGAFVEKVKRGSVADVEGHIRPGDEIIEWNGRVLRNKCADEVYQIIDESRLDAQVELVVSRTLPANAGENNAKRKVGGQQQQGVTVQNQCLANTIASSAVVSSGGRYYTRKAPAAAIEHHRDKPSVLITSPGSPDLHATSGGAHTLRQTNVQQRGYSGDAGTYQQHPTHPQPKQQSQNPQQQPPAQQRHGANVANTASATAVGTTATTTTAGHHHHYHQPPPPSHTHPHVAAHHLPTVGVAHVLSMAVEGRLQMKLGYDQNTLQLIVTIVCATGLTLRQSGAARNPYAKVFLLPDRGTKSKRRTKTVATTCEPRWGQTFVYTGLRRSDLTGRLLEVTLWDYVRYGANDFIGEVVIDLAHHVLDDEAEWYQLQPHQDTSYLLHHDDQSEADIMILTPTDHLSPPSTMSRLSDSDATSECDIDGLTPGRDGASISSLGSSSSPPPEIDLNERRSRRDMSPQGRKRVAGMVSRDYRTVSGIGQSYHNQQVNTGYLRRNGAITGPSGMSLSQRSHSAAPTDSYHGVTGSGHSYYRSSSPRRGSLSPPDDRYIDYPVLPIHATGGSAYGHSLSGGASSLSATAGGIPLGGVGGAAIGPTGTAQQGRFQSRSATATPTGSPKKRQLPQVPQTSRSAMLRDRLGQEFDERPGGGRFGRHRTRQIHHQATYRSTGMGGWERHYTGLSDSDLQSMEARTRPRHSLSPDKDFMGEFGDSDMESVVSVTSSAFSTQSERPRGSRGLSLPRNWRTLYGADPMPGSVPTTTLAGHHAHARGRGFFERYRANTIEVDDCDFLSTSLTGAPSLYGMGQSPPHLNTASQQMLLLEQLEQLQQLAELAAADSPPNTATLVAASNPHNILSTTATNHLLPPHRQLQPQQLQQLQQLHEPTQLPSQLVMTGNSGNLVVDPYMLDGSTEPGLLLMEPAGVTVIPPTPPSTLPPPLPPPAHTVSTQLQQQQQQQQPSLSHPQPHPHIFHPHQYLPHIPDSIHFPEFLTHAADFSPFAEKLFPRDSSLGSSSHYPFYDHLQRITTPVVNLFRHSPSSTLSTPTAAAVNSPHQHAHSVSSSPSSYIAYVRDHYDNTCSHCQNGSQPVVLSTNAALTTPGIAIGACDNPFCIAESHPHPQHHPVAYPYTAEQLLRRPSLSMYQPSSEPSLPTMDPAICGECVDQHFVSGLTAPQIDLGAVPTYHVHTPTPTAHKKAKSSLAPPPQLPTQSVLRLSRQLSEDALVTAIPIAESKAQPTSILKKPKVGVPTGTLDRRKMFHEGQSRSLDYDDLHAKSWGRRRIRYEDEIYNPPLEELSRRYGSETNIRQSYMGANVDAVNPLSHSHFLVTDDKIVTITYDSDVGWTRRGVAPSVFHDPRRRFDGRERNHMSLNLQRTNQEKLYGAALPYQKRRRNLPHPPSAQNAHNFSPVEGYDDDPMLMEPTTHSSATLPPHSGEPTSMNGTGSAERPGPIGEHRDQRDPRDERDPRDLSRSVGPGSSPSQQQRHPSSIISKRSKSSMATAGGHRTRVEQLQHESGSDRSNLVSINDQPEYFEYDDYGDPYIDSHTSRNYATTTTNASSNSFVSSGGSVRQKGKEVSYGAEQQTKSSSGSGSGGGASSTAAAGNIVVGGNISNNASSSSFANSHHGVANSTSPKRASLKHTNTTNDANLNVNVDGTTTTTTTTPIQTTTTSTNITTTSSSNTTTTTNAMATTNSTLTTSTTNPAAATTTTNTGDTTTASGDAAATDDADAPLDVIDWDAIDAMLDDDFSEYDKDKNGGGEEKKDDANFSQSVDEKVDGSLSDTATDRKKGGVEQERSPKGGSGMGKKSNSTSQLSATDQYTASYNAAAASNASHHHHHLRQSRGSAGSIQRSVEVPPAASATQYRTGSIHSISTSEGSSFSPSLRGNDGQLSEFIDGLGPGQLVGRQVLGAPSLGDIQLSMCHQKGFLEVEVIRARGLQQKPTSKMLPAPYVKVYLVSGKRCIDKMKTSTARRTLDPLYQQQLVFKQPYQGCILQVTVWGDYGRIEKKVFMGVAQIMLDDLNLSNIVIGWYKLFGTTSLGRPIVWPGESVILEEEGEEMQVN
ncbi:uncharacterized protein LOC105230845 isoform X1 [Bactrocera dorsalis]|uniref:Uncharacterized protein LOC105230845 isoform X1 n=2 Tax=Bactrocera dorsalis TaxID=27457 RepID=A0ABM3J8Z8_BACDO|nr:uncharacterized protein LOC105230845 isoform X1 [Bactrocera dorsalis]XP_049305698.1 uncharacterized protein LOC105230845 isoform X1 [Bactrocera dorsalis]XP_049305699.1 uncharacterized protein LOC105230845 isoform X1 [Bactrocera dorsalis]XP_049305700.1 uncharacterized protein LOC105230845 isoform X1 [Bactrocera dorsalis]